MILREHPQEQQVGRLPASDWTPFHFWLRCRFTTPAETSAGGIVLPETCRRNFSEAEVLAVGQGRRYAMHPYDDDDQPDADYWFCAPWNRPGDVVLFEKHEARATRVEDEVVVDQEAVLGTVKADGSLIPHQDFLLVQPEARPEESAGGVVLAQQTQRWRQRGTVLAVGPGKLVLEGGLVKDRRHVETTLNWPWTVPIVGATVWWAKDSRILQIGREVTEAWLLRASDVLGYEEE